MNMIKKGMWIAQPNRKGVYVISCIEDNYVVLRDVIMLDKKGNAHYGRKRVIGIKDLDNYVMV